MSHGIYKITVTENFSTLFVGEVTEDIEVYLLVLPCKTFVLWRSDVQLAGEPTEHKDSDHKQSVPFYRR